MVNLKAEEKNHVHINISSKKEHFSKIYAVLNIGYRAYLKRTYTRFELKFTKCVFRF